MIRELWQNGTERENTYERTGRTKTCWETRTDARRCCPIPDYPGSREYSDV